MAGTNFRFGLMAGACCAALGLLVPIASAQSGGESGTQFELAFWQAISASNDPVLYEAYLKQYPAGTFATIAEVKVKSLHKPVAPAAPTPLPVPQFGQPQLAAGLLASTPAAASALRDAAAAQTTAEAAKAAAAAALPAPSALPPAFETAPIQSESPIVTALAAPSAPIAPVTFAFAPSAIPNVNDAAQDLFGNAAAMPVGSLALLASLTGDPVAPSMPTSTPVLAPALALAAPVPAAPVPAAPVPAAPPAMLAALGAAPAALPTVAALAAAVASQSTPAAAPLRLARAEPVLAAPPVAAVSVPTVRPQPYYYAPAPARPQYAAAAFTPRAHSRRPAREAQFMRAVVSTAAVSVEMPDATRQISPLGIMLGQIVRSQETPGTQYGLQEEVAMPMRPRLMAMPDVALPESFCSSDQRSAFTEGVYQPALAIAAHNAEVASAYVRKLRTLYDNYQLSGDSTSQASITAEARDFARAANAANSIHDALVNQFEDIMATPLHTCGVMQ